MRTALILAFVVVVVLVCCDPTEAKKKKKKSTCPPGELRRKPVEFWFAVADKGCHRGGYYGSKGSGGGRNRVST